MTITGDWHPRSVPTMIPQMVGCKVAELDTPALIADLDAVEHNIALMTERCSAHGAVWRPHCKALRSPDLALKMIEKGAVGVTCAKLSQAAALIDGGVHDILVSRRRRGGNT